MTDDPVDSVNEQGLRFFGRATAGLSHELRNVLATVQQAAGLLEDYAEIVAQGGSVDPERFGTVTARVGRNADRGLGYIDLLNWLGHSLDEPASSLKLNEIAIGAVELARYPARQRRISLELAPCDRGAVVIGRTFEWVLLVHQCIHSAMNRSEDGASILVAIDEMQDGLCMWFETDRARRSQQEEVPTPARFSALTRFLGGRIESSENASAGYRIVLHLPRASQASAGSCQGTHDET